MNKIFFHQTMPWALTLSILGACGPQNAEVLETLTPTALSTPSESRSADTPIETPTESSTPLTPTPDRSETDYGVSPTETPALGDRCEDAMLASTGVIYGDSSGGTDQFDSPPCFAGGVPGLDQIYRLDGAAKSHFRARLFADEDAVLYLNGGCDLPQGPNCDGSALADETGLTELRTETLNAADLELVVDSQIPGHGGAYRLEISFGRTLLVVGDHVLIPQEGNGDGIMEPGETWQLIMHLYNAGDNTATQVDLQVYGEDDLALHLEDTAIPLIPARAFGSVEAIFKVPDRQDSSRITVEMRAESGHWVDSFELEFQQGEATPPEGTLFDWATPPPIHEPLMGVLQVSAGDRHSVVLRDDYSVWSWGANGNGQLGNGDIEQKTLPIRVLDIPSAEGVSAGGRHALSWDNRRDDYAWGDNEEGQLNLEPVDSVLTPEIIHFDGIKRIEAGHNFSLFLSTDGKVYGVGDNGEGQLGQNPSAPIYPGVWIDGLAEIDQISAGSFHGLALDARGQVFGWGDGEVGQSGACDDDDQESQSIIPIEGLSDITQIAAGGQHSLALDKNGNVYAWGSNIFGQLGIGSTHAGCAPTKVPNLPTITYIAAGEHHSLAVDKDGFVWSWGSNTSGQLGDGSENSSSNPRPVNLGVEVVAVAAGAKHSLAISSDETLWSWGANGHGQLGDGTTSERRSPVQVLTSKQNVKPLP